MPITRKPIAGQGLLERVLDADNLPALPAAALQILQMSQDDSTSVSNIASVVGQDPVLTAKVLRLVNSPLFGMSRRIISLPQALVALGLRTLKVLTLSLSILDSFGQRRVEWFDYRDFWRRCVTQAVAAKLLAGHTAPELCDEAFVAGLLSDLGILTMAHLARRRYAQPYRQSGGCHAELLTAEAAHLGIDHAEVAYALFSRWGLPDNLNLAVRMHHRGPDDAPAGEARRLVGVVHVAACVAGLFCDGASQGQIQAVRKQAANILSVPGLAFDDILSNLGDHVRESASLLRVDIGPMTSYVMLQQQAIVQLAELSVHSELERAQAERRAESSRQREQHLQRVAMTDALSGLANRAAFDQRLRAAVADSLARRRPLGLLMCDIDHFKRVNDTYGHPVGDLVIRATGDILHEFAEGALFAARYGGEEFALVVPDCGPGKLSILARTLCDRFRHAEVICSKGAVRFRISVGAACSDSLEKATATDLVALADASLYEAKRTGRARACVATAAAKVG